MFEDIEGIRVLDPLCSSNIALRLLPWQHIHCLHRLTKLREMGSDEHSNETSFLK